MPPHERAAAWLVTGPVGHLAAGTVDWIVLFWKVFRTAVRRKRRTAGDVT
jgi:hypothetical protein